MSELRRVSFSSALVRAYRHRRFADLCVAVANKLEGGDFYSGTVRDILGKYHGVKVGAYSYGECMIPGAFPPGVTIGRYVSVAAGVRVYVRNHPLDHLSLHPFFFNSQLGWLEKDTIDFGSLEIGHDAWVGTYAVITPGCKRIGVGATVGAGSVVTHDVPDFAIVVGVPGKVVRYRFPEETRNLILASQWWEKSIQECARYMQDMNLSLSSDPSRHPLLKSVAKAEAPVYA